MSLLLSPRNVCGGDLSHSLYSQYENRQPDRNMFNKLRTKLSPASRRDSGLSRSASTASTTKPTGVAHPQSTSTPATRRPNNSMHPNNPFADMVDSPPPYSPSSAEQSNQQTSLIDAAPIPTGLNQSYYQPRFSSVPTGPAAAAPSTSPRPDANVDNDKFAFLSQFDTKFLIDDSGSMAGSNWRETKAAIEAIAEICVKYDEDGIDIYFINKQAVYENVTSANQVRNIFESTVPKGRTFLGERMSRILNPYVVRCEKGEKPKPINLITITDGDPDDDPESVIVDTAKRLDSIKALPWQIGIQFFQVGRDIEATKFLEELDDELPKKNPGMRDIVDTQPYRTSQGSVINGEGILKTVLGAVNKRQDRKKGDKLHH